jgi:hypothetical protein
MIFIDPVQDRLELQKPFFSLGAGWVPAEQKADRLFTPPLPSTMMKVRDFVAGVDGRSKNAAKIKSILDATLGYYKTKKVKAVKSADIQRSTV